VKGKGRDVQSMDGDAGMWFLCVEFGLGRVC